MYDHLNEPQREAVFTTEGPLLLLAGAGSGKTGVLTHRIAHLIKDLDVDPYRILAITFTNKAAGEMRERVDKLVGETARYMWISTFHSACVRILRQHAQVLGYSQQFSIYDTSDMKTLIKNILKMRNIDPKTYKPQMFLSKISNAKNEMISPEEFILSATTSMEKLVGEVYKDYQQGLKDNNALDFDDLLMKTVELFQNHPDILSSWQERFRYILIDEYQDTNQAQFLLVTLLARKYKNLCVVGDDDQSIYRFRGANIGNILNFEEHYPEAKVIKLEQNYRSTQSILDIANHVIANNKNRKDKKLWTANGVGLKPSVKIFETYLEEADFIATSIQAKHYEGVPYQDIAILYRTNAQSRVLEEKFIRSQIPHQLIGGLSFYARKEVKDIMSYLKTVGDGQDDIAVERILNEPKRGIGATTQERVRQFAQLEGISFYEALTKIDYIPDCKRGAKAIKEFTSLIGKLKSYLEEVKLSELVKLIIEETHYEEALRLENTEEADARIDNLYELVSKVVQYEESTDHPSLEGFLEDIALVADIDQHQENEDRVTLMTLHSAKGLEFPYVFLTGMEDGLFPSFQSIMESENDPDAMEEERRLCYVGMTRARESLTMTGAKVRMVRGERQWNTPSRFISEIPTSMISISGDAFMSSPKKNVPVFRRQSSNYFKQSQVETKNYQKIVPTNLSTGKASLTYGVGDRVAHLKFGEGLVQDIADGGRDYEVTVDFGTVGRKKLFASFARLKKVGD